MAIDVLQYSLFPVRRDGQVNANGTAGSSGGSLVVGSGGSSAPAPDLTPYATNSSVGTAFATNSSLALVNSINNSIVSINASIYDIDTSLNNTYSISSYVDSSSWLKAYWLTNASLGTGFSFNSGTSKWDVSGGGSGVTQSYVDASLLRRDSSLNNSFARIVYLDSCLGLVTGLTYKQDSSIGWLTTRMNADDASTLNLYSRVSYLDSCLGLVTGLTFKHNSSIGWLTSRLDKTDASVVAASGLSRAAIDASFVWKSGDTITGKLTVNGSINANNQRLTMVGWPVDGSDAMNRNACNSSYAPKYPSVYTKTSNYTWQSTDVNCIIEASGNLTMYLVPGAGFDQTVFVNVGPGTITISSSTGAGAISVRGAGNKIKNRYGAVTAYYSDGGFIGWTLIGDVST